MGEVEIPWHSDLRPAREKYWTVTGPGNGWFAELRPGTTEWGRVDVVDPQTGRRLGSPPPKHYGKKWEDFAKDHEAKTGAWPLVQAFHSFGSLYVPVPLVVAGVNGVKVKESQGKPVSQPAKSFGGFLSRLFGNL